MIDFLSFALCNLFFSSIIAFQPYKPISYHIISAWQETTYVGAKHIPSTDYFMRLSYSVSGTQECVTSISDVEFYQYQNTNFNGPMYVLFNQYDLQSCVILDIIPIFLFTIVFSIACICALVGIGLIITAICLWYYRPIRPIRSNRIHYQSPIQV